MNKNFLKVGFTSGIFILSLAGAYHTRDWSLLSIHITVGLFFCAIGDSFMVVDKLYPAILSFLTAYILYSTGFLMAFDYLEKYAALGLVFIGLLMIALKLILPRFKIEGLLAGLVTLLTFLEITLVTVGLGAFMIRPALSTLLFLVGTLGILICDTIVGMRRFSGIKKGFLVSKILVFINWYGGLLALAVGNTIF